MGTGMDVIISVLIDSGRSVVNIPMIWTKIVIFGKILIHLIISLFQRGILSVVDYIYFLLDMI